jgi:hypothetical protein
MAAITFPATPTMGQKHTVAGRTWSWDGAVWLVVPAAPAAAGSSLIMAATAPATATDGSMWFDETGGGLYVAYKGAWVEVGGGGSKGPQVHIGAAPPTAADGNDGDYWAVYV